MARTKSRNTKRLAIVVLSAALTLTGAGAALAYWSSTGSGGGTATTGTSTAFTIAATEDVTGDISPGSAGRTVDFVVTNPGEGTESLSAVTVSLASPLGVPWVPAGDCLAGDYTVVISPATLATLPVDILAGESASGVATVTLADTGLNQDDCQGQEIPLYFQAS